MLNLPPSPPKSASTTKHNNKNRNREMLQPFWLVSLHSYPSEDIAALQQHSLPVDSLPTGSSALLLHPAYPPGSPAPVRDHPAHVAYGLARLRSAARWVVRETVEKWGVGRNSRTPQVLCPFPGWCGYERRPWRCQAPGHAVPQEFGVRRHRLPEARGGT
jgi:hypothetical protein